MTCPKCKARIKAEMTVCPKCGLPLTYTDKAGEEKLPLKTLCLRALAVAGAALLTICLVAFIILRIHYQNENKRITEQYVSQMTEVITLENGMSGHALTFFGTDGDCVYIEELGQSYMFSGGIARVEFADCIWFDEDPADMDSALITFSPIYVAASGKKTRIPVFSVEVKVPEAPITISQPAKENISILTSQTGLAMNVVYGSQVIINGEDVTSKVDRSGNLALTLNIEPVGDNNVSIIVRTPNHKEARRDLVIYRERMDIELEIDASVNEISRQNSMTINAKTEPGAWITVESDHDPNSVHIDQSTGKFSFKAKFKSYGPNLVTFRATKEGRNDSVMSFYINYLPAKAEYTRNAWTMDYAQLRMYYQQWNGYVFLCMGRIVDTVVDDNGVVYNIMNVGNSENVKLVALENQSNIGQLLVGNEYAMYADVSGRIFYKTDYIPCLITRYSKD